MAATSYTPIQYKSQTSTANNQNQYAQAQDRYTQRTQQQQSNPSQGAWQSANNYTPNWGQQTNQYASQQSTKTGQQTQGSQPPTPTPYTPSQAPGPWTPNLPEQQPSTAYTPYQTQTASNPNNTAGNPWTPADFSTQAGRDKYTAYMQANLPYQQFQQNNQQYANDFNESGRRDDRNFEQGALNDARTYGLNERQQTFSEWQSQEAANQWGAQFGQQQANDLFSQGLATNQQAIDQAYNEGRLSNEQRTIALNELSQREAQAYQYENLAQQMGWNREELASVEANQQRQDSLARWQQEQQAQQQQAQIAADRNNAILSATGRAAGQAPNTQWMRRF